MSIVMPGKYIVCVCVYIYIDQFDVHFPLCISLKGRGSLLKWRIFFFLKSHELSTEHVTLQIDLPFNK